MGLRVTGDGDAFLLAGEVATGQRDDIAMVNRFLAHLAASALDVTPWRSAAELLDAYDAHVDTMPICASMRSARHCSASRFVERFPDLAVWMRRPTPARLSDLHRLKAWSLVSWCFVRRHLVPDVELPLAKPGGCGLPIEWAEHEPDNVAAVAEAAAVLGWSANWQRQVGLLAASTICLHVGKRVRRLTEDDFATVLGQLDGSAVLSASARHHFRTRLFGLQQACYQLGQPDHPAAAGRAGGGRTTGARYRRPPAADPHRDGPLRADDHHHAAPVHGRGTDQGAAGVLRLPRRPPPTASASQQALLHVLGDLGHRHTDLFWDRGRHRVHGEILVTLLHGRSRAGDRHLNFYDARDNLKDSYQFSEGRHRLDQLKAPVADDHRDVAVPHREVG